MHRPAAGPSQTDYTPYALMHPDLPYGHTTNLVGIPSGLIASVAFNDHPVPMSIRSARVTNPMLFDMLAQADNLAEAAMAFETYLHALFAIDDQLLPARDGRRRFRASYRQLLEGWGYAADGAAGAVLKGWVESRFGLLPVFHKTPIRRIGSPAWARYVEEKMSSRYHNNCINLQLDLLYEFCQWSRRRYFGGAQHVTLYRGMNDFAEHEILARPDRHTAVVRMNSLVSFTADRAIADAFGDTLIEAQVPTVKLLFFRELLPQHPLTGEAEYLVLGGDYRVRLSYL